MRGDEDLVWGTTDLTVPWRLRASAVHYEPGRMVGDGTNV